MNTNGGRPQRMMQIMFCWIRFRMQSVQDYFFTKHEKHTSLAERNVEPF